MISPGTRSIRARLTLAFTISLIVVMALGCSGLVIYVRHVALQAEDRALEAAAARIVAEWSTGEDRDNLSEVLREGLPELRVSGLAVAVYNAGGEVTIQIPGGVRTGAIPPLVAEGVHDSSDGRWRVHSLRLAADTVVLGIPWADTDGAQLRSLAGALVLLSVIVVGVGALGAWLIVGRTLLPIALLTRQADTSTPRLAGGEIPHLSVPSPDREMVDLVGTLNALLMREVEAAQARGRFYAAASHELRTPLQALSGHLELVLSRAHRAEDEYRNALTEALTQTRRLTALARDLLLLNRLERGGANLPVEDIALDGLCVSLMHVFQDLLDSSRLQWEITVPPNTFCIAPPVYATVLIRNLLENAVRYASPGGRVSVGLRSKASDDVLTLEVFNSFDPTVRLDTAQLLEPFHRPLLLHAETGAAEEFSGNGLGLTICRAIADANGWALRLEQDERGVHATITLPKAGDRSGQKHQHP